MCLFESSIFTPRDDSKNVFTPTGPNAFAGLEMGNGIHEHLNTDQEAKQSTKYLHKKKKSTPIAGGIAYNKPMTHRKKPQYNYSQMMDMDKSQSWYGPMTQRQKKMNIMSPSITNANSVKEPSEDLTQSISHTKTNTVVDVVASVKSRNLKVNFLPTNNSEEKDGISQSKTKLPRLGKGNATDSINMPQRCDLRNRIRLMKYYKKGQYAYNTVYEMPKK